MEEELGSCFSQSDHMLLSTPHLRFRWRQRLVQHEEDFRDVSRTSLLESDHGEAVESMKQQLVVVSVHVWSASLTILLQKIKTKIKTFTTKQSWLLWIQWPPVEHPTHSGTSWRHQETELASPPAAGARTLRWRGCVACRSARVSLVAASYEVLPRVAMITNLLTHQHLHDHCRLKKPSPKNRFLTFLPIKKWGAI